MTPSARLSRLIAIIFLSNAVLVGWAAIWHHAGAQDAGQSETAAPESMPIDTLPLVTVPPPERSSIPAGTIPPGFVMEEIEKMAQDPKSGLGLKPLEYPSLELPRELEPATSGPPVSRVGNDSALERTQLRLAAISQLAAAATSLADEIAVLRREGQRQEAEQLTEQIEQLRQSIARLAAAKP